VAFRCARQQARGGRAGARARTERARPFCNSIHLLLRGRRNRAGCPGSVDRDHYEVAGPGDVEVDRTGLTVVAADLRHRGCGTVGLRVLHPGTARKDAKDVSVGVLKGHVGGDVGADDVEAVIVDATLRAGRVVDPAGGTFWP